MVGRDFIATSTAAALHGRLGKGEHRARRVPPHLPARLPWRPEEVAPALAAHSVAGGGVSVRLRVGQIVLRQAEAVAQGARVGVKPVGAGCLRRVAGVHELRRGRVRQGTSSPLAVLVRLRALRVESRELLTIKKSTNLETAIVFAGDIAPVLLLVGVKASN